MEEPKVLTQMFMSVAMDDTIRGLAFANRCNSGEIIHRAIQEYTCPTKKEELAALKHKNYIDRQPLLRDIDRLSSPVECPPDIPDDNRVMRSLHLSSADFNKVADFARKVGVSRAVIFRDLLQKHIDKNPRTF